MDQTQTIDRASDYLENAAHIQEHDCALSLQEFKDMIETKFCPKCKKRVVK